MCSAKRAPALPAWAAPARPTAVDRRAIAPNPLPLPRQERPPGGAAASTPTDPPARRLPHRPPCADAQPGDASERSGGERSAHAGGVRSARSRSPSAPAARRSCPRRARSAARRRVSRRIGFGAALRLSVRDRVRPTPGPAKLPPRRWRLGRRRTARPRTVASACPSRLRVGGDGDPLEAPGETDGFGDTMRSRHQSGTRRSNRSKSV